MRVINLFVLCSLLTMSFSCSTSQKNEVKETALEALSGGLSTAVSEAANCEDREGVKSYLKEKLGQLKVFKKEQEAQALVKKGLGSSICILAVTQSFNEIQRYLQDQTMFQRGRCSLSDSSSFTREFLVSQCEKIKF